MRPTAISAAVCLLATLCGAARAQTVGPRLAVPPPAPAGNPRAAVWKDQRVEFFYVGRTTRFSCDGLRDKVRAMLLDLGARPDLSIVAVGCADYDRMAESPAGLRLKIEFSSPALPEARAKPHRDGDLAALDARFQPFSVASDAFRGMGIGDCELVQQFAQQLLPKLAVRDVHEDIACIPHQPGGSRFLVRGEVLKALPPEENRASRAEPGRR